jgi:hypothetical protein
MTKILPWVMVCFALWPAATAWADHAATVYEKNSNQTKKLFTAQFKSQTQNDQEIATGQYFDLGGNLVFAETATLAAGNIVSVEIQQKQTDQTASVTVKDGQVFFSRTTDGKTETEQEKLPPSFVMAANFMKFVHTHWDELAAGKTIRFRYALWDRLETIGFELHKKGEETVAGQTVVVARMEPSDFFVSLWVTPIEFKFSADGSHLLEMIGRVPPKRRVGKTYENLDGDVVYLY